MDTDTAVAVIAAVAAVAAALVAFAGTALSTRSASEASDTRAQVDKDIEKFRAEAAKEVEALRAEAAKEAATIGAEGAREARAEERRAKLEALMERYRGPLLHAAYDLQSRLWNILCKSFVTVYWKHENERQQRYVVDNTLFLIGQYLCWIELIRLEVQFLDVGETTEELQTLRDNIYHLWQTDGLGSAFILWAGEQRSIGESMIVQRANGRECMGYHEFLGALQGGAIPVLPDLEGDIKTLVDNPQHGCGRLLALQHKLIEMLDLLDPDYTLFPKERRTVARPPFKCPDLADTE